MTATMPSTRGGGRRWLIPAAAVVVLIVMVVAAVALVRTTAGKKPAAANPAANAEAPPVLDACALIDAATADRLVPRATITRGGRDQLSEFGERSWTCSWRNDKISFGEFLRSRSVELTVARHYNMGHNTAVKQARISYDGDLNQSRYTETATDKEVYYSKVRTLSGVGDQAHAQYTWHRKTLFPFAFGEAWSRAGDLTVEIKFQAGQQRKDAAILTGDTLQAVTEQNALREVSGLITTVVNGAVAWRGGHGAPAATTGSGALRAGVTPAASPTPTVGASGGPSPSPSPTPIPLPDACVFVSARALALVPHAATKSTGTETGGTTTSTCRWLNTELPAGQGKRAIRSLFITMEYFTDRAGSPSSSVAHDAYVNKLSNSKQWQGSGFGGIFWGKVKFIKGLGAEAYQQYTSNKTQTVHAGTGSVVVRLGTMVVTIDFSGAQLPDKAPINSPKAVLIDSDEALTAARTVSDELIPSLE
ncbi:hypothetical protein J5X84_43105 [Streptosporangiaceae bacterium NEAU-GS5]|nr:hypothetical protein [Streptosporangiaceae bacterium NEAU-GS5]